MPSIRLRSRLLSVLSLVLGLAAFSCALPSALASQGSLSAQTGSPGEAEAALWPRHPSLSPDGETVVFTSGGDLWAASASGGKATRLSAHPAREARSAFSPDGQLLAFESDRDGAMNLYVAEVRGRGAELVLGPVRRVTVSDQGQGLGGFSADGSALYFAENRERGIHRAARVWRAPLDGGPVTRLADVYGAQPRATHDGDGFVYRRGRPNTDRPAYRGSGSPELVRYFAGDGRAVVLTAGDASEGDPEPLPDGSLLFLSSRDGLFDLWRLPAGGVEAEGARAERLAAFRPSAEEATLAHGIADLTASWSGNRAAFCLWDGLYVIDLERPGAGPRRLALSASADSAEPAVRRHDLSREVSEAVLSPDGKTLAVVARGEVLVRAVEDDRPTRRVTRSVAREADLAWSPCGTWLWFSVDTGEGVHLARASVQLARRDIVRPSAQPKDETAEQEPSEAIEEDAEDAEDAPEQGESATAEEAAEGDEPVEAAASAPSAKEVGERWSEALTFQVEVFAEDAAGLRSPLPSPCGRWLLALRGFGGLVRYDLGSGEMEVLLDGWATPEVVWAADGRHVVYAIEDLDHNADVFLWDLGEFGDPDSRGTPINLTRHPDHDRAPALSADGKVLVFLSDRDGNNWEFDVWAVFLDRSLEGLADWELEQHFKDAARELGRRKPLEPGAAPPEPLTFDAEDAWRRVRRLVATPGSQGNLALTPAGDRVLFSARIDGDTGLYSVDHRGRDRKTVHSSTVSGTSVALDGSRALFVTGGQARSASPSGGSAKAHPVAARIEVEVEAEQRQKFAEAARMLRDRFYHPTLKDLDWARLSERYGELAARTRSAAEFNRVLQLLFGELDGSHTGAWGGDSFSAPSPGNGYLGIDAEPTEGGWRVLRVLPDGPADRAHSRLEPGDVIAAVGDERLAEPGAFAHRDLHAALAGTAGQEVLLELAPEDGEENGRWVLIQPVSGGADLNLRYEAEVLARRAEVERLSEGRLGYLHIRGMNMPSVRDFERDLFAAASGREGLVIDVRDNGGGSTTDILLSSLTAPVHAYTVPRGADADAVPRDTYPRDRRLIYGYSRPINVLINANSFSNAEIFAHAIRTIGRGRTVGEATYGGVISTGAHRLIDGTTVRIPFRGWYLPDGTDMENNGTPADVPVALTPQDELDGRDPQLEAAVRELLERL